MKQRYIAASMCKADLEDWINDKTFPTMCAIAALYLFEDAPIRRFWRCEVWENFRSMKVRKWSRRLPSAKFIFNSSWGLNRLFVQDAITWAIKHNSAFVLSPQVDKDELYSIMENYFTWLSTELSTCRVLASSSVLHKLDELGLKE